MKVKIEGIRKVYNEKEVVHVNHYQFSEGKIYAIIGGNGAGKTTLLRMIAGVEQPTKGTIYYNGQPHIDHEKVSYMPQQIYLFDTTVLKNVSLGIDKGKRSSQRIQEALKYVGMNEFSNKNALQLSGGESQRVAIARLLVRKRALILMDEPSSSTDITGNKLLADYMRRVNKLERSTIIFVTHNPALASKVADECVFMAKGKIVEAGTSKDIIYSPKTPELQTFIENWKI